MSTHITSHCFRLGLAALLLLTASTASAQWPQGLGGDRNDEVTVVKTAPGGDLFVAGHFSGSIETASGTVSTVGLQDVFVARFGPGGQLKWLRGAGGENQEDGDRQSPQSDHDPSPEAVGFLERVTGIEPATFSLGS